LTAYSLARPRRDVFSWPILLGHAAVISAGDLLLLFPDVHDGYDRLGMVYEARGENRQAADCLRAHTP
jgi:hypothetical protein